MKLTEKQKRFCDEYIIDFNATRAYKLAYPSVKKDETAMAAGSRLLRNVKVKEYIDKRIKDREKRTEITQDNVIKELAAIAFANGTDFAKVVNKQITVNGELVLDEEGNPQTYQDVELKLTDKLNPQQRKAISSIKRGKFGIEVSTCDKVRALELLGKHLGMFTNKVEVSGNVNNPFENLTTEELIRLASGKDG